MKEIHHGRNLPILSALACLSGLAWLQTGCTASRENVLAITSTVIGVQVHQKDADKTPELKVGYARQEFAFVPTDRGTNGSSTNSAEVLMEINAKGNIGLGTAYQGGIYQRLAVGRTAVGQPGAAFMMAKDHEGAVSPEAARAVSQSFQKLPTSDAGVADTRARMARAFQNATPGQRELFEAAAKNAGYRDFGTFASDAAASPAKADQVEKELRSKGVSF